MKNETKAILAAAFIGVGGYLLLRKKPVPPIPPAKGRLVITTDPVGRDVYLDTVPHGVAPVLLGPSPQTRDLTPGDYEVSFGPAQVGEIQPPPRTVTVAAGATVPVLGSYTGAVLYTLSKASNPAVGGTISLNPAGGVYAPGTEVTLTAAPALGYMFNGWGGDASGGSLTTITMDSDKNITANFVSVVEDYTLTTSVAPAVGGTISLYPAGGVYAPETVVRLTATPAFGYIFSGWSGAATGSLNPIDINMDSDKSITANFVLAPIQRILTTSVAPAGSGMVIPSGGTYNDGSVVYLTIVPASGWGFSGWSGDATGLDNPLAVTMDRDKNIVANFHEVTTVYTLTTGSNPLGAGVVDPNMQIVVPGTQLTLTALPIAGYNFSHWSGDASGSQNPITITMDSDKHIVANFTEVLVHYVLTTNVNPAGSGFVDKNPAGGIYSPGTVVRITALRVPPYFFNRWSGDISSSANPVDITMNSNMNITANFVL